MISADGSYPRPQLRREEWTDLTGEWEFRYDDADEGLAAHWQQDPAGFDLRITVPYPPESPMSGIGDPGFHPVLWYRREITVRPLAGQRLLLHLGAVDYEAMVWVDGVLVAQHRGGHTPFTADITDALGHGPLHSVTVRAVDRPIDATQPRGKQDWQPDPHGIWYQRTSGIWQPVWMELAPDTHLHALTWTPDLPRASVRLDAELSALAPEGTRLRVVLSRGADVLAEQEVRAADHRVSMDIAIPALRHGQALNGLLWSPESPNLLDAHITVGADEASPDQVRSYLGLRSVGFRDGQFLLNGKPYYLRLALEQGYWPDSHLATPDAAALRREVELARELGFNGVRIHQKVEDPRFLEWCDRLGLLVWDELPSAYEFGTQTIERLTAEWLEVIRRDASHPCVVAWVPLNESWGVPDIATDPRQRALASGLYHLTKAMDGTRPVVSNDGWEHTVSDLWTVHDYDPDAASLAHRFADRDQLYRVLRGPGPGRKKVLLEDGDERGQPVLVTEFGGLSFAPRAGEKWTGYGVVASTDELRAQLDALVQALLDAEDVAGFCYTQLTDTMQERNGLLTEDREPKLPPEVVREILTRPSRSIPAETVDAHRRAAQHPQR